MVGGESLGTLIVSALKELTDVSQIQNTADNACGQTATKVITHPNVKRARPFKCPCQIPAILQTLYTGREDSRHWLQSPGKKW